MKFYLVIVFLMMFLFPKQGETQLIRNWTGSDTVVNTATVNLSLSVSGSYDSVVFGVTNTKLSGTAAGTSVLYASANGVSYKAIGADTLTNTNQTTNYHMWVLEKPAYPYYKIVTTGSGTMDVITSATAHFKKL
jgi:hypothetical protein